MPDEEGGDRSSRTEGNGETQTSAKSERALHYRQRLGSQGGGRMADRKKGESGKEG